MFEYMTFWFAKIVTEFFTAIVMVALIVFGILFYATLNTWVISPYKNWREKKYWISQTPQWRKNRLSTLYDNPHNYGWPKDWQIDMVEKDKRG